MSKKELDFGKLAALKPKKAESNQDTEQAIKVIHEQLTEKEKVKRVTIDLPFSIYVDIRKKIIDKEQTLKDYFVTLAKADLE